MGVSEIKMYTGVGSRKTPLDVLLKIEELAAWLASKGWILRSGGADGADSAFEKGCDSVGGIKEIYLPWRGFNDSQSQLYNVSKEAIQIAAKIHPAWEMLSGGAKKLHARNVFQCLGENLDVPSKFLVCWTPKGAEQGGTRTAIVLAKQNNIPVFNLFFKDSLEKVKEFVKNHE